MSRAGSQKAVSITTAETIGSRHSLPRNAVWPDVSVEVAKGNQFAGLRRRREEGMQVLKEFGLCPIRALHWDAYVDPQDHQSIVYALRQTGQKSYDVVIDCKGEASVASFCLRAATPEGVADCSCRSENWVSLRIAMSTL
ncbi:unnamed protein product [Schistocephalus solidus]|uniref:Zeta_toxin domain-containing protein n=1 Tax=Schistocephalus solidus TaxID=70667 RepID=A0A183SUE3_SCHSO|nr:unnamed protein product [Schistocephalus solidus]